MNTKIRVEELHSKNWIIPKELWQLKETNLILTHLTGGKGDNMKPQGYNLILKFLKRRMLELRQSLI